jgi:hypothetical protein
VVVLVDSLVAIFPSNEARHLTYSLEEAVLLQRFLVRASNLFLVVMVVVVMRSLQRISWYSPRIL